MFCAEAHVGRGGRGVCIICSVCQVVIVACCFIPLFSIPESVPHSFVLFSLMPAFRANQKAQRHRLRSVALNLSADQAAEALEYMAKRWHEILDGWKFPPHQGRPLQAPRRTRSRQMK